MNARVVTRLLVIIYGLSITGFGIMEFSHEIAHIVKNNIHHHEADHDHVLVDHVIKSQEPPADDNNTFLVSCGFLFSEAYSFAMSAMSFEIHYCSPGDSKPDNVILKPFIPPPAKIS